MFRQWVVFDDRAHDQQRGNHAAHAAFAVGNIEQLAILALGDERGEEFVPAYRVEAVDTTAAGDVFNGALAVALSEGRELGAAARFAAAASSIACTRIGAQRSIPQRREVDSAE